MYRYILKRLLMLIPVIFGVALLVFVMVNITAGDAASQILPEGTEEQLQALREDLGLNDPILIRFGRYMWNLCHGDMGTSYYRNEPVFDMYIERLPATIMLAVSSMVVAMLIAIPLGIISALKQYSLLDNVGNVIALIGVSMPNFWVGLLLIILFSLMLGMLPSGGMENWKGIILPAITYGSSHAGLLYRMTRSSMLEVIRQDYITTARAKGIKEQAVIMRHALRNAWIPVVTVLGTQLAGSLAGSTVIETVFSWPGVGRLLIDSFHKRDVPVIVGGLILSTVLISLVNLLVDIIYAFLDPRIKAEYRVKRRRAKNEVAA